MIPSHIYMVGIGGIGMSALAQLLVHQGKAVSGSDREDSPTTLMLREKGIDVSTGESRIPQQTEMLIYSDAVPAYDAARVRATALSIPQMSYFEALGVVSKGVRTIAVAGTHGKTTTTAMLTKILQYADKRPTAIIGSLVRDFSPPHGSNFLAGDPNLFVIEACEYRDHVLQLSPEILVITNIELDHTDYFPRIEALQETFRTAVHKVSRDGYIVTDPKGANIAQVLVGASAKIVDYTHGAIREVPHLIGVFNQMNARAAAVAAMTAFPNLSDDIIKEALGNFRGSWRRFEYKGETLSGTLVYDDYAHHPTSVEKTIIAAREKFPGKRIVVAFHPHLYSRTRFFLKEFASALSKADFSVIAPIYAAREADDPSVSNHILAQEITALGGNSIALDSFDEIREFLLTGGWNEKAESSLIITMGAGDIYKVAEQIVD